MLTREYSPIFGDSRPLAGEFSAFAPINIALVKYWGKRDMALYLPETDSLSITVPHYGTRTTLRHDTHLKVDRIILNGVALSTDAIFYKRLLHFLNLFRQKGDYFHIETENNIPTAAGLASSASGFAACTLALSRLYGFSLSLRTLSAYARRGSGSACRSFWPGFVLWQKGHLPSGEDSHGVPLQALWPDLRIAWEQVTFGEKKMPSTDAMQSCKETSTLYPLWPEVVREHLSLMQSAIKEKNFDLFGKIAEQNALSMHATMQAAWPPIYYANAHTIHSMEKVWELRKKGLSVYFTQDAGPHLKLLFLAESAQQVCASFPELTLVNPFVQEVLE